jgi:hypothetical protein
LKRRIRLRFADTSFRSCFAEPKSLNNLENAVCYHEFMTLLAVRCCQVFRN